MGRSNSQVVGLPKPGREGRGRPCVPGARSPSFAGLQEEATCFVRVFSLISHQTRMLPSHFTDAKVLRRREKELAQRHTPKWQSRKEVLV